MIAILGAGAWGSTFASVLADAGNDVVLWARNPAVVTEINANHTNATKVPGHTLPPRVRASTDLVGTVAEAGTVVVALPSQVVRQALAPLAGGLGADAVVVSLMKGIELGTGLRMSSVLSAVLEVPTRRIVVLSGPNLSREIAERQPTASVLACEDIAHASRFATLCATPYFRPYVSDDVIGVEICGALKNVIAIAVGMADGVGYGDNTKATIITRGLAEIGRLAAALGADPATIAGLAGMGDLVATCASPLSRNHVLGARIGRGMTLEDAVAASQGIAEGAKTCRSVAHLAGNLGVDMPMTNAIVQVLYEGLAVADATRMLLQRPRKDERS